MSDDRKDQLAGQSEQASGRVKEDLGKLTGDDERATEGRIEQAEGAMTEGLGKAQEEVHDAADDAKDKLSD